MLEELRKFLVDWAFWTRVAGCLVIWYFVGLLVSRGISNYGTEALAAVRRGAWWSLVITVVLAFFGAWFIWSNLNLAVALGAASLVLLFILVLVLTMLEPRLSE